MCVQDVLVLVASAHGAVLVIVLLVVVWDHNWVYAVFRIIPESGSVACYLMAFTLLVELIGKKKQFYETLM